MADNDSYEKDMEEIFGETRGERERKRLEQISDAAAESVRLANDFKQELKKEEIQSDDPIIQKCLDIVRNKKVTVEDLTDLGYYDVYLGNKKCFMIHKDFSIAVYKMKINNQDYRFCGKRPDLEELHKLCVAKYNEQSPERKKSTLDFLNDVDRGEKTKTDKSTKSVKTSDVIFGVCLFLGIVGVLSPMVVRLMNDKKTQRVKKQVDAFEKTLPAEYLEYKQAVEHYRDSLMHAKRR